MNQIEDRSEQTIKRRMILSIVFLVAGIVYAISPIDLIPDILGPIGWIDDILFLIVSFTLSALSYLKMRKEKKALEQGRQ
jgi:uncharacterized membrane protein YkvA (DUF1232 family)